MPAFVFIFILTLVIDLGILGYILTFPGEQLMFLLILILFLIVPMLAFSAGPRALLWKRKVMGEGAQGGPLGSALAPLTCVSSLVFLVCTSLLRLAPREEPNWSPFHLLVFLYLVVQFVRLHHGMVINLLVAVVVLTKPDRPGDRIFALGSALGAGAGLALVGMHMTTVPWLWPHLARICDEASPVGMWMGLILLTTMSFCYGLMLGGTILWLLGRRGGQPGGGQPG